jgi:hydroxyacylglutathione hydrolase
MRLTPLPAFADNYIWLLQHQQRVLAVDPGDGQAVLQWLRHEPQRQLDTILVTHHHADHTGGLPELVQATGARVFGPALEKLPVNHTPVAHGDTMTWGPLCWQVLDVPGHTAGHVAYHSQPEGESPILFCGDTLFSGGCGRLFEGTAAQMLASLDLLATLPADTRVCCAHEYTLSNLRFALAVEPDNPRLQAFDSHCRQLRAQGLPTLPARLGDELDINPFLRSRIPAVRAAVSRFTGLATLDDAQVFAQLREWKNGFK